MPEQSWWEQRNIPEWLKGTTLSVSPESAMPLPPQEVKPETTEEKPIINVSTKVADRIIAEDTTQANDTLKQQEEIRQQIAEKTALMEKMQKEEKEAQKTEEEKVREAEREAALMGEEGTDPSMPGVKGSWQTDARSGSSTYGKNIFIPSGKTMEEVSPMPTEPTEEDKLDESLRETNAKIDQLYASYDRILAAQTENIKNQYAAKVMAMKDINRRREAVYQKLGIVGGTARYAAQHQVDIMTEEISQGMARIFEIEASMNVALANAEIAIKDKQYNILNDRMNDLRDLEKERNKKIEEQNKQLMEDLKKIKEQQIASGREAAIVDVISQGIENPYELYDILNYDDEGNKIGDITLEEIGAALKLKPKEPEELKPSGEYQNFILMQQRGDISPDLDWFTYNQRLAAAKREPKEVGGIPTTPGELSPLAKSVYEGTLSLKDLTPTARAQVAPELNAIGWSSVVTEEQKADFGTTRTGMDAVLDAWRGVPAKYKGYIQGVAAQLLGAGKWNPEVAKFNAALGIVGMQLTRLFEKGRISDQDRIFYMSLMPNLQMNEVAAVAGADELKARLEEKLKANISEINKFISGTESEGSDLRSQVIQKGYDYDQLKADGHSDEEIRKSLSL